jgi:hypothetical protein
MDNAVEIPAEVEDRPDVAEALKNPDVLRSGFRATFLSTDIGKGPQRVRFRGVSADGSFIWEASQQIVLNVQ